MPSLERENAAMSNEILNLEEASVDDIDTESARMGGGLCLDSIFVWIPLLKSLDSIGFLEKEQKTINLYSV
ncbi:MAG: hypothetical protein U9N50_01140 [Pseudomonadota bacterium]|nr:hypothetical protein [Pseudomonadota bacterium]